MKKLNKNIFLSLFALLLSASSIQAQTSLGADYVSAYIWRGAQLDASAVQPYIEYTTGNLTIGTWGSYSTSALNLQEVDFYFSYALGDLSVGITDYYIPENDIFDLDTDHVVEANLGYSLGDISVSANYTFAGATDGDTYVELGYSGTEFDVFAGLGNNAYVTNFNGDVGLVNFGFSTSKEIEITEKFSLPIYGSLIVNPESRIGYLVFGISL
jgi:hypothetical protein